MCSAKGSQPLRASWALFVFGRFFMFPENRNVSLCAVQRYPFVQGLLSWYSLRATKAFRQEGNGPP